MRLTALLAASLLSTPALAQSAAEPAPAAAPPAATAAAPADEKPPVKAPPSETHQEPALPVAPVVAPAKPPPPAGPAQAGIADRVKLSGRTFLRYSYEIPAEKGNFNEFAIDRLYLTSEFTLSSAVRVVATIEGGDLRLNGTDNLLVVPKQFFLEAKDFLPGQYFRFGLVPMAWVPYTEDIWGYRAQGPVFVDRAGYLTSTDLGLALGGSIPAKYGSWQLNVVNGETWKKKELGKRKELQLRVALTPLTSLGGVLSKIFVAGAWGFGRYDDVKSDNHTRWRGLGQVGLKTDTVALAGEYLMAGDSAEKMASRYKVSSSGQTAKAQGVSVFGTLNFGALAAADVAKHVELFARYDWLDPDKAVDHNNVQTAIGGLTWVWTKDIKTFLDYEQVVAQPGPVPPGATSPFDDTVDKRLKLQADVRF